MTKSEDIIPNPAAAGVSYYTPAQVPPSGTAVDPQPNGNPIPKLFQPLKIRSLMVQNRVWLSPLCQYSAQDGHHTAWHQTHLGGIIQRGPGLAMVEATAITPEGRITPEDSGIWTDSQIEPLRRSVEFAHSQNQILGIQLGHAGRKASMVAPWISRAAVAVKEVGGWPDRVIGTSPLAYEGMNDPKEMTKQDIEDFKTAFGEATKRALKAGFDFVEIHNAHGYLLNSFISPATNKRTDEYGGDFQGRIRLTLEVVDLVRSIIPDTMPLFLRISASDALEHLPDVESWTAADTARLAPILAEHGVDVLDCSGGGNDPRQKFESKDAYQADWALPAKKAVGDKMIVTTVGSIKDGKTAQKLLDQGLDAVFCGRWFQRNPGLVWQFADDVGVTIHVAHQIAWAFQGYGGARPKK